MFDKPKRKLRIHKDVLKELRGVDLDTARGGAGNEGQQQQAKNSRPPDSCNGVPICGVKPV